jgi:hypothetical protein
MLWKLPLAEAIDAEAAITTAASVMDLNMVVTFLPVWAAMLWISSGLLRLDELQLALKTSFYNAADDHKKM